METVAIFGVGLIGGSFALALRAAGFSGRIVGVSSPATIATGIELGAIDEGLSETEAAARADLVFLARPIGAIIETLGRIAGNVPNDALVTDAGSTKSAILRAAEALPSGVFLGGHPMAGKELQGIRAASADLFRGRPWVLTPVRPGDLERPRVREFLAWVERIGALPLVLDAEAHDRTVALSSHLPQLASTALAATLADHAAAIEGIHGPGLEDMTRLALSSFDIWRDILATNAGNVTEALESYIAQLQNIREALRSPDEEQLRSYFQRAGDFARPLRDPSNRPPG